MEKVTFLVSNKCNFRCKHCFVNAGSKIQNELSEENKYKAIDNLVNLGVNKITFSGGEPLMEKNLFKYIKYAKSKNVAIGFLTNGLLLDEKKIEQLKKLVDTFSISLYSQDILGVENEFYSSYINKTIRNLKILTEKHFNFQITIPISTNNKDKAIDYIKLIYNEKIKARTIRIYMITPLGRAKQNKAMCTEKFNCSDLLKQVPDYIKQSNLNISTEFSSIDRNEEKISRFYAYCPIINYTSKNYINKYGDPHMDANGDLYLCGLLLREKEYCIGNILKNSKEEIIDNIRKLSNLIKTKIKEDCCPALNRHAKKNEILVCPVIYLKTEMK